MLTVALVVSVGLVVASPARIAGATTVAALEQAPTAELRLVDQNYLTAANGTARFVINATGIPAGAEVVASVYPRLANDQRAIDDALRGSFSGDPFRPVLEKPFDDLRIENGAIAIEIPTTTTDTPGAVRLRTAGVYPVRVRIVSDGESIASLVTFIVRFDAMAASLPTGLTLVLPLGNDILKQPGDPDRVALTSEEAARLTSIVNVAKAAPALPLTYVVRPETVDSLGNSPDATHRQLASDLGLVAQTGEVIAETFTPIDPSLASGALDDEYAEQLEKGRSTISSWLGSPWVDNGLRSIDGPMTNDGLKLATETGMTGLLVRNTDLKSGALPPITAPQTLTWPDGKTFTTNLAVVDPDLSAMADGASRVEDPVLEAWRFLARFAHRSFADTANAPRRGLVVENAGEVSETFLGTLAAVAGRSGDGTESFLKVRPLSDLLLQTPAQKVGALLVFRSFVARTAEPAVDLATALSLVRLDIAQLTSMTTTANGDHDYWLTLAASTSLTERERALFLDRAKQPYEPLRTAVEPPERVSVTLNSGKASIPVTLRSKITDTPIKVRVRLTSTRARFPENDFVAEIVDGIWHRTVEIEALEGRYDITVEVFPLKGDRRLTTGTIDVQTFNIGGLGILLSGALAALLATWWVASIRKKRRIACRLRHPGGLPRNPAGSDLATATD